ncbi:MAG: DMT family transporter, partial [Erythrobacter sp.]|nr:DMT family transporter [Erythrobacter sp.]
MAAYQEHSHHDRPFLALLMRLAGIGGLATMSALIKLASESGVHLVEILFWRQMVTLPILLGWALWAGGLHKLATQRPKSHGVRAVYGIIGMILNFGAVVLLPLAEATTFSFTTPLFAVLLSIVFLKEKVGPWRWSAVAAGFLGIIIIAQPSGDHFPLYGAAVALGGAFMVALISIQIRDLSRTDAPQVIVFYFALVSVVVLLGPMLWLHEALTLHQWLLLLGVGLCGTFGQLGITAALRMGKVSSVIVMD